MISSESCGAESAFAFEVVFEKRNVIITFVTFSSVMNVKLSHLMETIILTKYSKGDDLAISTKNVKCNDGQIVTFWTNER